MLLQTLARLVPEAAVSRERRRMLVQVVEGGSGLVLLVVGLWFGFGLPGKFRGLPFKSFEAAAP